MDDQELQEIVVEHLRMEDAARNGLIRALDASDAAGVEHGGLILYDPIKKRYYTPSMNAGTKNKVTMSGVPRGPKDTLAGSFHSHPSFDQHGEFSETDVESGLSHKIPMYMSSVANREGRLFDPAASKMPLRVGRKTQVERRTGDVFMPGHRMVREDPSVLDADKAARRDADRSAELVAEILRKPR
jgi:proteasome lid subunit RPN8/RPN11